MPATVNRDSASEEMPNKVCCLGGFSNYKYVSTNLFTLGHVKSAGHLTGTGR